MKKLSGYCNNNNFIHFNNKNYCLRKPRVYGQETLVNIKGSETQLTGGSSQASARRNGVFIRPTPRPKGMRERHWLISHFLVLDNVTVFMKSTHSLSLWNNVRST